MIDNRGNMFLEDDDIIELMLQNKRAKILPKNSISFEKFQNKCKQYNLDIPFEIDSAIDKIIWNMPIEYQNIDIEKFIKTKYNLTEGQLNRVQSELQEFEKRNLYDLLKFLLFLVDTARKNNVIYGVGRGSSVASYVLFLLGVHRIDSYKYNLDIKEFLK